MRRALLVVVVGVWVVVGGTGCMSLVYRSVEETRRHRSEEIGLLGGFGAGVPGGFIPVYRSCTPLPKEARRAEPARSVGAAAPPKGIRVPVPVSPMVGAVTASKSQSLTSELRSAAREGDLERVKELVAQGADVNGSAGAREWGLPLWWAAFRGHLDVAEYLVSCGARKDPFTAAAMGDWDFVAARLDEQPSLVHTVTSSGQTLLHWANRGNQVEFARRLLDHGVDPNCLNDYGAAPLLYAAREGHVEFCRLLIENGANVNFRAEPNGKTPIREAAENGNVALAELLLARGADPNVKDTEGLTPLDVARQAGSTAVADLLTKWTGGRPN